MAKDVLVARTLWILTGTLTQIPVSLETKLETFLLHFELPRSRAVVTTHLISWQRTQSDVLAQICCVEVLSIRT